MSSLMSRWWRGALAAAIPAALALAGPFVVRVDAGNPTGPSARVYLEKAGEAPVSAAYAVSLKADPALFAGRTAHDHAIVIDTSASQVGEHRTHSLAVLKELLAALPADDRVCLYAADVKVAKLTDGYVAPGEVAAALKKLSMRAPLGATDLAATLKEVAAGIEASDRDASIVYIGDGMSAAGVISSDPLKTLCAELRDRKIAVHSYAVGPRLDLQLLGILAQQTGGLVLVDRAHEIKNDPGVAAHRLATAIDAPIVYPEQVKTEPKVALLPEQPLPIRGDRETIYLGRGEFPKSLQVTATGKQTMNWTATATAADAGHPFLAPHYRQAESTDGISVSFAGNDMLMAARQGFDDQVADLVSKGEQAVGQRQVKQAQAIGDAILQIDPDNVKAKAILGAAEKVAARQARGNRQLAQAQPAPPAPPAPGNDPKSLLNDPSLNAAPATPPVPEDLIEQEKIRRRVRGEQLNLSVDSAINEARRVAPSDPDAALNLIKNNLNTVQVADDVDPDLRRKLAQRLSIVHAEVTAQRERANVLRVRAAERLSQLEAQQRLVEQSVRDDERLEQLIDRVRTLMIEGDHGHDDAFEQAEAVARIAVDLRPDSGTAAAAVFVSEAAGQLRKAFRLRALRADKFLEVLYQVELSHVPFPDEPPILWPPAEVWKALTERRKKWASVDLHRNSPAEERIQSALRDETEIQFVDTPLKEAMDFLSDLHQITIIVDETALMEEGIATDEPITRELSGITLRSAMKIILEPLGLTYIIKDEVMKITTQVKADEIMSTRVYPVGDLVIPIITPLAGGIGQGLGGVGGFGGSGGLGGFGGQFGLGGAGYGGGGGFGGGGLGGGGFYSVPVEEIPQSELNAFLGQDAPAFDNEAVKAAKKKLGPAR